MCTKKRLSDRPTEQTNERTNKTASHPSNVPTNEQTTNPFACQMKSIRSDWNASFRRFEIQTYHLVNYLRRNTPKCFENGLQIHNDVIIFSFCANAQCKLMMENKTKTTTTTTLVMMMMMKSMMNPFEMPLNMQQHVFMLKFQRTNQRQKLFVSYITFLV